MTKDNGNRGGHRIRSFKERGARDSRVSSARLKVISLHRIRKVAPPRVRRMAQDGTVKILQGVTSFEELNRIVDLYDEVMLETIA